MDILKGFLRVRSSNSTSPSASVVAVVLLLSFNSIFVFTSADDSTGTLPPIFLPYSNIILYSVLFLKETQFANLESENIQSSKKYIL